MSFDKNVLTGTPKTHNGELGLLQHIQDTIAKVSKTMKIGNTAYGCTVESGKNHNIGDHDTSYNAAWIMTMASQWQVCMVYEYVFILML